jgi:ATP phosphoribosyltransferase
MNSPALTLAVPSKGRMKDQVEAWLADAGLKLQQIGGARGYTARLEGLPAIDVRLMSASDIADALLSGSVHMGVTGEDLLREAAPDLDASVFLVRPLGFARADVVVAVPDGWLDVATMADLGDVAASKLAAKGKRLRVATKYTNLARRFFDAKGVEAFRVVESLGATEAAPAGGLADVVVDITTTGATLAANNLKLLGDGLILRSEAQLCASLGAEWSDGSVAAAEALVRVIEARARARENAIVAGLPGKTITSKEGAINEALAAVEKSGGEISIGETRFVFRSDEPRWAAMRTALEP